MSGYAPPFDDSEILRLLHEGAQAQMDTATVERQAEATGSLSPVSLCLATCVNGTRLGPADCARVCDALVAEAKALSETSVPDPPTVSASSSALELKSILTRSLLLPVLPAATGVTDSVPGPEVQRPRTRPRGAATGASV